MLTITYLLSFFLEEFAKGLEHNALSVFSPFFLSLDHMSGVENSGGTAN